MDANDVLSELLAGDYTTCFEYYRPFPDSNSVEEQNHNNEIAQPQQQNNNNKYAGRTVCWLDQELLGDHPTCQIEVNGDLCNSCDICDNKSGPTPLIRYDCTNIFGLEHEQVNECGPNGEGLHDTILQFLDSDSIICPTSEALTLTWTIRSALSIVLLLPMLIQWLSL